MEVLHPRCCGLDVHKETVVSSLCIGGGAGNEMARQNWLPAFPAALGRAIPHHGHGSPPATASAA
jgi:hypothetical protein